MSKNSSAPLANLNSFGAPSPASSFAFLLLHAHGLFGTMLARAPACSRGAPARGARRHPGPPALSIPSIPTTPTAMPPLPQGHQGGRRRPLAVAPRSSLDDTPSPSASASAPGGMEEGGGDSSLENGGGAGGCPVAPFRSSSSPSSTSTSSRSSPSPSIDLPLPPGSMGFPVLGENLAMLRSPSAFHRKRREKHGEFWVLLRFFKISPSVQGLSDLLL